MGLDTKTVAVGPFSLETSSVYVFQRAPSVDGFSTYELMGIPDSIATVLVLVAMSLMLAPWFGGLELGPLKVPKTSIKSAGVMQFGTPLLFVLTIAGFFPFWADEQPLEMKPQMLDEEAATLKDGLNASPTDAEIAEAEVARFLDFSTRCGKASDPIFSMETIVNCSFGECTINELKRFNDGSPDQNLFSWFKIEDIGTWGHPMPSAKSEISIRCKNDSECFATSGEGVSNANSQLYYFSNQACAIEFVKLLGLE